MLRTTMSALTLGLLCVVLGAPCTIAVAGSKRGSHHRASHAAHACHRAKHRHCRAARLRRGAHRKHKRHATSKPSEPISGNSGSPAPWVTVPSSVAPDSAPGSDASPAGPASPGAAETPAATATPARIEVTAQDSEGFRFVLSRPTVPAGKVIVEFVNHGQDGHNLHAVESTEGAEVGAVPYTPPNHHPSVTLELHPGSYTLFCSLPGHEAKGMKATLVVQ